jgi:peptidoglycan/LPS O-acetylase OafA/YrhL
MRAIAALMVLLFHFISYHNGNTFLVSNGDVRNWSEFGAQGVEMFYIISGFVMTLSLTRKKYRIGNLGRYLLKRALRILPLYWSVILSIVVIQLVLWGNAPDGKTIFANLFFLAGAIEGTEWLNLVFGTLGVEVQFYLLLGLIFPLIRRNLTLKYAVLLAWLLAGYFTIDTYSVLSCAPFFIIGMLLHDLQTKIQKADLLLILGIVAGLFWIKWYDDVVIICLTMVLFLVVKPTWKPLTKVGEFSYSIYLTHGIFGSWLLYFTSWESYGNIRSAWLIVPAIIFSLAGAYAFYYVVEKPSIRWSKKVKM